MSGLVGKRVRAAVPGLGEENGAACGGGGRVFGRAPAPCARPREPSSVPRLGPTAELPCCEASAV